MMLGINWIIDDEATEGIFSCHFVAKEGLLHDTKLHCIFPKNKSMGRGGGGSIFGKVTTTRF